METQILTLLTKYFKDAIGGKLPPPAYGAIALVVLLLSIALYSGLNSGDEEVRTTDNATNTAITSTINRAKEAEDAVNEALDFSVSRHVELVEEGITTEINGKASDDTPFLE